VAQPGESVAVFNDALARLSDRLTYLYSGNHRYWYDTHPNLRRTAEDRPLRATSWSSAATARDGSATCWSSSPRMQRPWRDSTWRCAATCRGSPS
jgi:hypothetical protein